MAEAKEVELERLVLGPVKIVLRRELSDEVISKLKIGLVHDWMVNQWAVELVGEFVGSAEREPVVISEYTEPRTWWDALKRAWSEWIAPTTDPDGEQPARWRRSLRLRYDVRIFPRLFQELRVCPHSQIPFNNRHAEWVVHKRPLAQVQSALSEKNA